MSCGWEVVLNQMCLTDRALLPYLLDGLTCAFSLGTRNIRTAFNITSGTVTDAVLSPATEPDHLFVQFGRVFNHLVPPNAKLEPKRGSWNVTPRAFSTGGANEQPMTAVGSVAPPPRKIRQRLELMSFISLVGLVRSYVGGHLATLLLQAVVEMREEAKSYQ